MYSGTLVISVEPLSHCTRSRRITRDLKLELHKYFDDTFRNNFGCMILDFRERGREGGRERERIDPDPGVCMCL
jgi:hypothetical protein